MTTPRRKIGLVSRPERGAMAVFRALRTKGLFSKWSERALGNASWLVLASTALILLLPRGYTAAMARGPIAVVLGVYFAYVIVLEMGVRCLGRRYDWQYFRLVRIVANLILASTLVWFGGGARSYFWLFYALPIFQAIIYLGPMGIRLTTATAVTLYCLASLAAASTLDQVADIGLLFMNSAMMSILALLVHQFFVAAREARRLGHLEALQAIEDLTPVVDTQQSLSNLLDEGVRRACEVTKAKSGSIMLLDKKRQILTIRARYPTIRAWYKETRSFEVGQGIAGWVAEHREPCLLADARQDPRFVPAIPEPGVDPRQDESIKSLLVVPIMAHRRVLGVMNVDSDEADLFDENDEQLLWGIASSVADRIYRVWLLDALHEVGEGAALELHQAMGIILDKLEELVGYDYAAISLIQESRVQLVASRGLASGEQSVEAAVVIGDDALCQELGKNSRPLIIPDARADSRGRGRLAGCEYVRGWMGVPLVAGSGEVIGCLILGSRTAGYFDQVDADLVSVVANHASTAILSARIHEHQHRWTLALEALQEVSLEITKQRRLPQLVTSILDQAVRLLGAKGGALYLLDEQGMQARIAAVSGLPQDMQGSSLEVGDSLLGQVARMKTPMVIRDYHNWPQRLKMYDPYSFKAVAGAPIIWRGEASGVIVVHHTEEGQIFDQQLTLLWNLADLAAVAFDNARRLDDLERLMASAIDAIIVIDESGHVVRFNKQAEKILGYRAQEVLGTPVERLYYDPKEPWRLKQVLLHSEDGRIADYRTAIRTKNGERVPIWLSASLLYDHEGKRAGSVGFFRDVRDIEIANRQIRQLKGVLTAGQAITSQLDLRRVLDSILTNAWSALDDVDAIILYLYDPDIGKVLMPPVAKGVRDSQIIQGALRSDSVVTRLISHGRPHFADDSSLDDIMRGDFVMRESIASSAAIPLEVGHKIMGVMFFNYRQPHPFSEEERSIISILANQAAIAVGNAQLFEAQQHRSNQLDALHRVALAANQLEWRDVLRATLAEMVSIFGVDQGGVMLIEEGNSYGRTVAEYPSPREPHLLIPLEGNASIDWIRTHRRPLVISEAPDNPLLSSIRDAVVSWGVQSMLLIPLAIKDQVIGTIGLDAVTASREFTQSELELAETMASQVAISLENFRNQEKATAIETVNAALTLITRWAHRVRQKGYALQNDVRNLKDDLPAGLFDDILGRMSDSIDGLSLPMQRIVTAAEEGSEQPIDLSKILHDVSKRLCQNPEVPISLRLRLQDERCMVIGNRLLFEVAAELLLQNAIEAIELKKRRGRLTVQCHPRDNTVRVSIVDTGTGMPEDVASKLFRSPFKSMTGHGLGSFTAASVIRAHGGNIRLAQTSERGTKIEFWLPASEGQAA